MSVFLFDLASLLLLWALVHRWTTEVSSVNREAQHGAVLVAAAEARATPLVQALGTLLQRTPEQLFALPSDVRLNDPAVWMQAHALLPNLAPACTPAVREAHAHLRLAAGDTAVCDHAQEIYAALCRLDAWLAGPATSAATGPLQLLYDLRCIAQALPILQTTLVRRRRGLQPLRWLRRSFGQLF